MDEYRVELRRVTGDKQLMCSSFQDNKIMVTTGTSTVLTNLQEFSIYNVTITAVLSEFNATLNSMTDFIALRLVAGMCDSIIMTVLYHFVLLVAPTASPSFITINATSRNVSVSWTEIECIERNGPITNYTVEFQEVGGALTPGVVVNRTFTASELTPYTNYTFRVAGVNDAGTGPFSNTSIQTKEESM